jgi:hypothetical protein
MRPNTPVVFVLVLLAYAIGVRAESSSEKDSADDVVVGKVEKVSANDEAFGEDGVRTEYTAEIHVEAVEKALQNKGKTVKYGDTVTVRWSQVTKAPTRKTVGNRGHSFPVKEYATVRAYLLHTCAGGYVAIDHANGIQRLDKADK